VPEPAVVIEGLVKRYGARVAVDGLSMEVARGSVTALLGPNGAGKTTTIECCEGYRRPDAGRVRVLGLDPRRDGAQLRRRVGVMLQAGGVYPGVRAEEMLRHVAGLYANPVRPELLMERLGLTGAGKTPYRRLSGGQRQRLGLALAIVGRPELVFLDEPTAGLDPQARLAAWDLVRELRTSGVTVLLSTHLMDEAERLADRVFIIDRGRLVAAGAPSDLGRAAGLRLRGPAGLDPEGLRAAVGAAAVRETEPGAYLVECEPTPAAIAAIAAWCAERSILLEELGLARPTLEEVFLEVTGREVRA